MDTITQAVLGAAVGQAGFSKTLGRRANWYGALAGLTPDFDILARLGGEWQSLVYHRGPTHALWFGPVVGTILGYATWRYYKRKAERSPPDKPVDPGPLRAWIGLWVLGLLTHPLLDTFTTYGTQLLAPFSDARFAVYGVGIIDPFYTVPLALALFIGWKSRLNPQRASRAALAALVLTCGYLTYGVFQNGVAKEAASNSLSSLGVQSTRVDAYPTVFQPWLRRVVARDTDWTYVAYVSNLAPGPIEWHRTKHRLDHPKVQALLKTEEGRIFEWFSSGQIIGRESLNDQYVYLEDFRYGFASQPHHGMWGMKGLGGQSNFSVSDVSRTRNRPTKVKQFFSGFWTSLWGDKTLRKDRIVPPPI